MKCKLISDNGVISIRLSSENEFEKAILNDMRDNGYTHLEVKYYGGDYGLSHVRDVETIDLAQYAPTKQEKEKSTEEKIKIISNVLKSNGIDYEWQDGEESGTYLFLHVCVDPEYTMH